MISGAKSVNSTIPRPCVQNASYQPKLPFRALQNRALAETSLLERSERELQAKNRLPRAFDAILRQKLPFLASRKPRRTLRKPLQGLYKARCTSRRVVERGETSRCGVQRPFRTVPEAVLRPAGAFGSGETTRGTARRGFGSDRRARWSARLGVGRVGRQPGGLKSIPITARRSTSGFRCAICSALPCGKGGKGAWHLPRGRGGTPAWRPAPTPYLPYGLSASNSDALLPGVSRSRAARARSLAKLGASSTAK